MEDGRNAELDALRPQRVVVERAVDTEGVEPVRETTTISGGSITEGAARVTREDGRLEPEVTDGILELADRRLRIGHRHQRADDAPVFLSREQP